MTLDLDKVPVSTVDRTKMTSASTSQSFVNLEMESEFVRACLQKPGFAQRLISRIPDAVFTNEIHQWIMGKIRQLSYQNRGRLQKVPIEVLSHMTSEIQDVDKRGVYQQAIRTLYSKPVEYEEYAERSIKEYASYQVVTSGMRDALSQFKTYGDVDRVIETMHGHLKKAQAVKSDAEIYDYTTNWQQRQTDRRLQTEFGVQNARVRTGIPGLDEQIRLTPGTVTGFVAPFKRFKSIVLNHIGVAALYQGFNVLHVTLENPVKLTADRYDSRIANVDFTRLTDGAISLGENEKIEQVFNRISNWPQRLKIFAAPAQKTTIADVEAEISHLEINEGFSPEVIILDYANIFAPSVKSKTGEERLDQTQVVWDCQQLAKQSKPARIVVTAFQSKNEAVEKDRITSDQIGKAVGIAQGVEAMVAINQNKNEKQLGIVTLSPLFIRYGKITRPDVVLDSNFGCMNIDIGSDAILQPYSAEWDG